MKKLLLLSLLVATLSASAQKKDSVATYTTPLLSINDLARVDSLIQRKFSIAQQREYQEIASFMQAIVNDRVQAYNKENKPQAKK
jgi:hypothetical protein